MSNRNMNVDANKTAARRFPEDVMTERNNSAFVHYRPTVERIARSGLARQVWGRLTRACTRLRYRATHRRPNAPLRSSPAKVLARSRAAAEPRAVMRPSDINLYSGALLRAHIEAGPSDDAGRDAHISTIGFPDK